MPRDAGHIIFSKKFKGPYVGTVPGNMTEVRSFNRFGATVLAFNAQKFRGSHDTDHAPFSKKIRNHLQNAPEMSIRVCLLQRQATFHRLCVQCLWFVGSVRKGDEIGCDQSMTDDTDEWWWALPTVTRRHFFAAINLSETISSAPHGCAITGPAERDYLFMHAGMLIRHHRRSLSDKTFEQLLFSDSVCTNSKRRTRPTVATEIADRTAYVAIIINDHLDKNPLRCSQQHKQNGHVINKARYNFEFWGGMFEGIGSV